ncbi:MAG: hypothetical protein IKQ06_05015 [Bacilli bacterium]|nr:hypothetical protein [Bacilli bacterium]
MKLVPEQIYYLRKLRREMKRKIMEFNNSSESRNRLTFEDFYKDSQNRKDVEAINEMLTEAEFVKTRNFEMVDIGTIFLIDYGDGYKYPTMLVDKDTMYDPNHNYIPTDSEIGSVLLGAKEGDIITFILSEIGRKMTAKITDIDRIQDHYMHFIKEKTYKNRVCAPVKRQMAKIKTEEGDEAYKKALAITESQVELLYDELKKLDFRNPEDKSRINEIKRIIKEYPIASPPTNGIVEAGSKIVITFVTENSQFITKEYEFINRAVSTELDSEYIERISDFGNEIYGLSPGDPFRLPNNNWYIGGVIESIDEIEDKKRVR